MKWASGLSLIVFCLLITGCNKEEKNEMNESFQVKGDNPIILTHDLEGGMEELIEGVLEYDKNTQCLFIKSTNEDDLVRVRAPIWPKGTTPYTENGLHGVKIPDHGTILEGDFLKGGGGGIEQSELKSLDIPKDCIDNHPTYAITDIDK